MSLKVPVEPTEALWYFCRRVAGCAVLTAGCWLVVCKGVLPSCEELRQKLCSGDSSR